LDEVTLAQYAEDTNKIREELMAADPHLHPITALIVAGDVYGARLATKAVEAGEVTAREAFQRVGSYARFEWAVNMMERGYLPEKEFFDELPALWRGSDPDDTNPRFLRLWQHAYQRNGSYMVKDGKALKRPADGFVTVYRGGDPRTVRDGIAWTTNPKIATKFARGAGERVPRMDGVVIRGRVKYENILAYLTGRGEAEVITEPKNVQFLSAKGLD
jgi:hypothetical protein